MESNWLQILITKSPYFQKGGKHKRLNFYFDCFFILMFLRLIWKKKGKRGTWGERKSSSSKWVLACLKSNPCHEIVKEKEETWRKKRITIEVVRMEVIRNRRGRWKNLLHPCSSNLNGMLTAERLFQFKYQLS